LLSGNVVECLFRPVLTFVLAMATVESNGVFGTLDGRPKTAALEENAGIYNWVSQSWAPVALEIGGETLNLYYIAQMTKKEY